MSIIELIERRANRAHAEAHGLTLIEDLSPAEQKAIHDDMEAKARYVRTAAGVARFKRPIGAIILPRGLGSLDRIRIKDPVFKGFDLVEDRKGNLYDVGKDDSTGKYVALKHNTWDDQIKPADSLDDALAALNEKLGGGTNSDREEGEEPKPKPEAKKPAPKKAPSKAPEPKDETSEESPAAAKPKAPEPKTPEPAKVPDAPAKKGRKVPSEGMGNNIGGGTVGQEYPLSTMDHVREAGGKRDFLDLHHATHGARKATKDELIALPDDEFIAAVNDIERNGTGPAAAVRKHKGTGKGQAAPKKGGGTMGDQGSKERDAFIESHPKLKGVNDYHKPKLRDLSEKNFQDYLAAVEGGKSPDSIGAIMSRVDPGASWNPTTEKWVGQNSKGRPTSPTPTGDTSASDAADAAARKRVQKMKDEERSKGRTNPFTSSLTESQKASVDNLTPGQYAKYMNQRDAGHQHYRALAEANGQADTDRARLKKIQSTRVTGTPDEKVKKFEDLMKALDHFDKTSQSDLGPESRKVRSRIAERRAEALKAQGDAARAKAREENEARARQDEEDRETMKRHGEANIENRPFRAASNAFQINAKILRENPDKSERIRNNRIKAMEESIAVRERRLADPRYSGALFPRHIEGHKRKIAEDKKELEELRAKVSAMPKDGPVEPYIPPSQRPDPDAPGGPVVVTTRDTTPERAAQDRETARKMSTAEKRTHDETIKAHDKAQNAARRLSQGPDMEANLRRYTAARDGLDRAIREHETIRQTGYGSSPETERRYADSRSLRDTLDNRIKNFREIRAQEQADLKREQEAERQRAREAQDVADRERDERMQERRKAREAQDAVSQKYGNHRMMIESNRKHLKDIVASGRAGEDVGQYLAETQERIAEIQRRLQQSDRDLGGYGLGKGGDVADQDGAQIRANLSDNLSKLQQAERIIKERESERRNAPDYVPSDRDRAEDLAAQQEWANEAREERNARIRAESEASDREEAEIRSRPIVTGGKYDRAAVIRALVEDRGIPAVFGPDRPAAQQDLQSMVRTFKPTAQERAEARDGRNTRIQNKVKAYDKSAQLLQDLYNVYDPDLQPGMSIGDDPIPDTPERAQGRANAAANARAREAAPSTPEPFSRRLSIGNNVIMERNGQREPGRVTGLGPGYARVTFADGTIKDYDPTNGVPLDGQGPNIRKRTYEESGPLNAQERAQEEAVNALARQRGEALREASEAMSAVDFNDSSPEGEARLQAAWDKIKEAQDATYAFNREVDGTNLTTTQRSRLSNTDLSTSGRNSTAGLLLQRLNGIQNRRAPIVKAERERRLKEAEAAGDTLTAIAITKELEAAEMSNALGQSARRQEIKRNWDRRRDQIRKAAEQRTTQPEPSGATGSAQPTRLPSVDSTLALARTQIGKARRVRTERSAQDAINTLNNTERSLQRDLTRSGDRMTSEQRDEVQRTLQAISEARRKAEEKTPVSRRTTLRPSDIPALNEQNNQNRDYREVARNRATAEAQELFNSLPTSIPDGTRYGAQELDRAALANMDDAPSVPALNRAIRALEEQEDTTVDDEIRVLKEARDYLKERADQDRAEFEAANTSLFGDDLSIPEPAPAMTDRERRRAERERLAEQSRQINEVLDRERANNPAPSTPEAPRSTAPSRSEIATLKERADNALRPFSRLGTRTATAQDRTELRRVRNALIKQLRDYDAAGGGRYRMGIEIQLHQVRRALSGN